jgi:hypothetical protein
MPLSIPAFDQYQSPMFPLRGLWNCVPREGDKFVNVEIDWQTTTKTTCVQFSLSGNSPVALSQIVALYVDNGRSGSDVDFIFPDSGFVLTVPAHNQGMFPVLTNALMFYASAPTSALGDVTIVQILNSLPPPIPIVASTLQNHAAVSAIPLVNGSTIVVPQSVGGQVNNGTLNSGVVILDVTTAGSVQVSLTDGLGASLWSAQLPAIGVGIVSLPVGPISVRFIKGVNFVVASVGGGLAGTASVNLYYSTP